MLLWKTWKKNQECKTHTCTYNNCTPPSTIYITFSTAVAFSAHSGAVFVLEDKVTPRVADGRSGPAGGEERGKRRQKRPSLSHKSVWGSEVGEASALAWGDIASLGETCCRGVCCLAFQHVGGSLSRTGLTFGQRGSITVSVGWHTHTRGINNICFIELWSGHFYTKTLIGDYSVCSRGKVKWEAGKLQSHPKCFYNLLPIATVWAPCGAHGTVKKLPDWSHLTK